jgi:hypothetical protein
MSTGDIYQKISGAYVLQGNIGGGTTPSSGGSGVGSFPNFIVTGANQITLPAGSYPKAGYRHRGTFPEAGTESWILATAALLPAHSGSLSSNPLWCSLFMTAADELILLPCIGVKGTPSYSSPNTTIHPGMSDGAGGMNDVDIVTNWQTNMGFTLAGYRLVKHSNDINDGKIFTIASVAANTPDDIVLSGDQTTFLSDLDWLRMVPPAATPCLYLGLVAFNGSDLATYLRQVGWRYFWLDSSTLITGNKATSAAWSDMAGSSYGAPPYANRVSGSVFCSSGTNDAESVVVELYTDITVNPVRVLQFATPGVNADKYMQQSFDYFINKPGQIGNTLTYYDGVNSYAADSGGFTISDFEE